jgi:hypothetical protein
VDVHQPHVVRLRNQVGGMRLMLVVLGRLGPDLLLRELAREGPELALLWRQREGHPARDACLERCHVRCSSFD